MNHQLKNKSGFTLVEIMLAMTVFAVIMTSILLSVESLSVARIKTENRVKLLEELYFFSEQLVNNVKEGGTIDYEEYWNRKAYGNTILSGAISIGQIGGAYSGATGVGNYGSGGILGSTTYGNGLYYCTSKNGSRMGTGGCLGDYNNLGTASGTNVDADYSGRYQRYGQYVRQFMDHNSNADNDGGDEDGVGGIVDDEDDKDIGNGPTVLSGYTPELYLINPTQKERIYFRHVVRQDTGTGGLCNLSATGYANDSCVGNVQVLKMRGVDYGYTHSALPADTTAFDGKIDTWLLHRDWPNGVSLLGDSLATGTGNEWVDLFPNNINVKSLQFYVYPQGDPWISWDARDCNGSSPPGCLSPFIHPYVRIQMTVGFAWGKRRTLKNDDPTVSINTTVTLGDKE